MRVEFCNAPVLRCRGAYVWHRGRWGGQRHDRGRFVLSTVNCKGEIIMSLKGKVAIVTGGNSGIGMAIVLALAQQGANIVIDYVARPEATEALEKQVAALGDQAIGVQVDVSKVTAPPPHHTRPPPPTPRT